MSASNKLPTGVPMTIDFENKTVKLISKKNGDLSIDISDPSNEDFHKIFLVDKDMKIIEKN